MDIRPKPLINEILPGFTLFGLFLWIYFKAHPSQLDWILSPPPNITSILVGFSAVGFFVSWVIGHFIETTRNECEYIFDKFSEWFSGEPLNWDFFFEADPEKVEQVNDWYYSYYCLNCNFVIVILVFYIVELAAWWINQEFIKPLSLCPNLILAIALIISILGAVGLRCEIKRLVKKNSMPPCPHHGVYVRLKPSTIDKDGVGVFAILDIPKGTKLFNNDDSKMIWINNEDIGNSEIDLELKNLYNDFCVLKNGKLGCPKNFNMLTVGWYLNEPKEGDNPNVCCKDDYDFMALRDIKKGEELTVVYSTYSEHPKGIMPEPS